MKTLKTEFKFWLYDPNGWGMRYFKSEEERNTAVKGLIDSYYSDDGWEEEVLEISAGEVTHIIQEINRIDRPEVLDENDYDEDGNYWNSDWDSLVNYELRPIKEEK